ncbi:MAG: VOC family protein [Verrucomicrobiaceae bacterium]|nr:VOC family protein [Verrucomicrobiaceae bacterium]
MSAPSNNYPPFSPYLTVRGADKAIEFYKTAFGAEEVSRLTSRADGTIGHAELTIAGSLLMLSEENPEWGNKSPQTLGGTAVVFCLTVENTDAAVERAIAAGATLRMPVADQFYGFRSGSVVDPFGQEWLLQHEIEKVSPEEAQKRWDEMSGDCSGS